MYADIEDGKVKSISVEKHLKLASIRTSSTAAGVDRNTLGRALRIDLRHEYLP
jgi:hypothetical protein